MPDTKITFKHLSFCEIAGKWLNQERDSKNKKQTPTNRFHN